jgi:hypothetical protein
MAISYDSYSYSSGTGSWMHTVGSGTRQILVLCLIDYTNLFSQASNITAATYNGVSYSGYFSQGSSNGDIYSIYYWLSPSQGSNSFQITSSNAQFIISAVSFNGVDQSNPFDQIDATYAYTNSSSTLSQNFNNSYSSSAIVTFSGTYNSTYATASGLTNFYFNNSLTGTNLQSCSFYYGLNQSINSSISWSISSPNDLNVYGIALKAYIAPTLGCSSQPFISSNTIVADFWRVTNVSVSPGSIVGNGNDSNGLAQKFQVTPILNVGLATTVSVLFTPSSLIIGTSLIKFSLAVDLNQSSTQSGFYTGLSTTFPTAVTFIVTGPNNCSVTMTGLTLNPFLISSISISPIWPTGIVTTVNTYQYAGIGATYLTTINLNAYVPSTSLQTAIISTPDPNLYILTGSGSTVLAKNGIVTFSSTKNVGLVSFFYPAISRNTSITTSVTFSVLNSTGIATATLSFRGINTFYFSLDPIMPGRNGTATYIGTTYYPTSLGFNWSMKQYYTQVALGSTSFTIPVGVNSYSVAGVLTTNLAQDQKIIYSLNSINQDLLDTQTYYVDYYSKQGFPKAMGFDSFGELSQSFTQYIQPPGNSVGQGIGTFTKVYMGLPNVVKTASGSNHNLALTTSGIVYAIGSNQFGQLYVNTIGYSTNLFTRIGLSTLDTLYNSIITDIYAQNNSSYIITSDRKLYSFGQNSFNQLGFSSNGIGYTSIPALVSNNVSLLSVYNNRGFFATYDDNYSFNQTYYEFGASPTSDGTNTGGALSGKIQKNIGIVSYKGASYTLSSAQIQYIDVGNNHTLAACSWSTSSPSTLGFTSGIIAWGYNNNYQLGTSFSTGFISVPQILTKFDPSGNVVPLDFTPYIVAGNQWSLGVVSNNGINSTYFYGPGSSVYNGGWISPTSITTSIGLGQSFFNDPIYKIAKSKDHILWLTGVGSVYASGGSARLYLKNVSNTSFVYQSTLIYIDGAPNNIPETQAYAYYPQVGIYSLNYFGIYANGLQTSNSGFKKITSSISTIKSSSGFDIIMILFNNNEIHTWAYYNKTGIASLVQLPGISTYIASKNIVDIGVGKSYTNTNNTIPAFVASYSANGTTYTNIINTFLYIFNNDNSYNSFTYLSPISTLNEAQIVNVVGGLTEAKLEKTTLNGTSYDWISSNYNIVAGYSDGLISVFSDANLGFGTLLIQNDSTPRLVAQFAPSINGIITAMKVIYLNTLNSNLLMVAVGRYLYGYIPKRTQSYSEANWQLYAETSYSSSFGNIIAILPSNYSGTNEYVPIIFSNGYLGLVPLPGTTYYTAVSFTQPLSVFVTNNPSTGKNDNNFVQFLSTQQNVQEWYFPFENFEIGLDYWNYNSSSPYAFNVSSKYPTQLLTKNGQLNGVGISNISHVSASDWFTILIDSLNSSNI